MSSIPYSRFHIGSVPWYSFLIVTGVLIAVILACREERRLNLPKDTVIDLALWLLPCGIVGARLYYVIFSWDNFRDDFLSVFRIWEGGIAIYGGIIGGLIVLAAMPFALRFANLTDQGKHYLRVMLLINTYYVMGQAVNTTLIAGVFRAGGDSRFGMICDTIDMWCYAVPLGFLAAAVLKLPPLWVYFLLCTDEFVKWPWVIGHYRSKKWLKNIPRENVLDE